MTAGGADPKHLWVTYEVISDHLQSRASNTAPRDYHELVTGIIDPFLNQFRSDVAGASRHEHSAGLLDTVPGERERHDGASRHLVPVDHQLQDEDFRRGRFRFRLGFAGELFEASRGGIQHLFGILVGDLFDRARDSLPGDLEIRAIDVDFGPLAKDCVKIFRAKSHDIHEIRQKFRLDNIGRFSGSPDINLPLLAYSLKPRLGASPDFIRATVLGVLKAGFNIVELDTRNLQTTDAALEFFVTLAQDAATLGTDYVTRFSPNLSMPAVDALAWCERFQTIEGNDPWVIKVDGGLDGLSTIQAIRKALPKAEQPIITCYPILRDAFASRIGREAVVDALTLSGADIIYPGGAPRIGPGGFIQHEHARAGYERYWRLIDRGYPMPSLAGGIHAGQLAAYHEMFGPRVAYFLGSGVALHRNGAFLTKQGRGLWPKLSNGSEASSGAELCVDVLKSMAVMERQQPPDYDALVDTFGDIQKHYFEDPRQDERDLFQFHDPRAFLDGGIRRYTERGG